MYKKIPKKDTANYKEPIHYPHRFERLKASEELKQDVTNFILWFKKLTQCDALEILWGLIYQPIDQLEGLGILVEGYSIRKNIGVRFTIPKKFIAALRSQLIHEYSKYHPTFAQVYVPMDCISELKVLKTSYDIDNIAVCVIVNQCKQKLQTLNQETIKDIIDSLLANTKLSSIHGFELLGFNEKEAIYLKFVAPEVGYFLKSLCLSYQKQGYCE